jgi:hypothetical protein
MLSIVRRRWAVGIVVGLILLAGIAYVQYKDWLNCHGKPLVREEALQDARSQLQDLSRSFSLGNPLPSLSAERYDDSRGEWMFTFSNGSCTVDIITDRCKGTDIGGVSKGCTKHRTP